MLFLTPRLGEAESQLGAHGVETFENPPLPLALNLDHVSQGFSVFANASAASYAARATPALDGNPLFRAFGTQQVKHSIL